MTRVEFFDQDGRISGFCCSGHSGYAEAGSDIVCAAVSTAVKFAETTLSEVLGERVKTKVNEEEARITLQMCIRDSSTDISSLKNIILSMQ